MVAAALLIAASHVIAQEELASSATAIEVEAGGSAEAPAAASGTAVPDEKLLVSPDSELSDDFELPENFELPEDFQAVTVYHVPSEEDAANVMSPVDDVEQLTVIGVRRRRSIVDVQVDIKNKTEEFFDLFNEIVVDDAYKIKCAWFGSGAMKTRTCAAGYVMKDLKDRQFFGAEGVYRRPPREYFEARQAMYTRAIIEALQERPSLMVLVEEINALQDEERRLSGSTRLLERQAERQRRRELLGPEILRAARRDRPGRQRP